MIFIPMYGHLTETQQKVHKYLNKFINIHLSFELQQNFYTRRNLTLFKLNFTEKTMNDLRFISLLSV